MEYQDISLGALPSKPDANDFNIAKLLAPVNVFPDEFIFPFKRWLTKNQGYIGSCVPHKIGRAHV